MKTTTTPLVTIHNKLHSLVQPSIQMPGNEGAAAPGGHEAIAADQREAWSVNNIDSSVTAFD